MNPITTIHDAITGVTVVQEMTDADCEWFALNCSDIVYSDDQPEAPASDDAGAPSTDAG